MMKPFATLLILAIGLALHEADAKPNAAPEPVFTDREDAIWSFRFLPGGEIIYTERGGKLLVYDPTKKSHITIGGAPEVVAKSQGGLLDVELHPRFKDNRLVYLTYSAKVGNANSTRLAQARLETWELKSLKVLFTAEPAVDSGLHFGSRLAFDDQGFLYMTVGERNERDYAQKLDNHLGKVLRFKDDGSVPEDNPFRNTSGAKPEIWSYGHRNPQGLTWIGEKKLLLLTEHGPRGGDEVNRIIGGKNYGWPLVTYGKEYWGPSIGEGVKKAGIEAPLKVYVPSIAPSGVAFYRGNLFLGALKLQHINKIRLPESNVDPLPGVTETRLATELKERIRDVRLGPDGWLYFSTDSGKLFRLDLAKLSN